MADFESTNKNEDTSQSVDPYEAHVSNERATELPTKQKPNLFGWKIVAIVFIGVIALVYTTVDIEVTNTVDDVPVQAIVVDERLFACNNVVSGELTEDFSTCLSAAEDGETLAIKRIIWGYSRSGEFQNWKAVFSWLKAMPRKDENTRLLMYAIVHFMASSDELKKDSEEGISRLVAKNYPPANVLLASIYALDENVLPPTSNAQWLLERESNEEANVITPSQLAVVYANGFVGKSDLEKATDYLKQLAQRNFPVNTNNIAWFLSTLDENPFTTQEYALSLAKQVTDDPEHSQNPIYVDTLAASLAASGMFDEALVAQERAIVLLSESEFNQGFIDARKLEFESRLSLYKSGEALIEESVAVDKKEFFNKIKSRIVDYLFRDFYVLADEPSPSATKELSIDENTL